MKMHRIFAIVLRNLYANKRSLDRLVDMFYWPAVDLTLWGITSAYFQNALQGQHNLMVLLITGIVLWFTLWIGSNSIALAVLQDLWDRNLVNILVSPLSFAEWMTANILIAAMKVTVSFSFAMVLAFFMYKVNLIYIAPKLIIHIISLTLMSWWVSFIIIGMIMRLGTRIQTLAWALVYVLSPFSAIFYPLKILPPFAQKIAQFIPSSYVFESMREVVSTGYYDVSKLGMSFLLNAIYLALTIIFLKSSIDKARDKGFASLY